MAAETGFDIDGTIYEVPSLDSLDMDEAQILYDYSGLTLEDFVPVRDEDPDDAADRERQFKNPGLLRALMHITYQRGNPDMKPKDVRKLIGSANVLTALMSMGAVEEVDGQIPPASTTEPEPSLPSGSVEWNKSSGPDSTTDSDQPDSPPATTGTGRSDTSSPALVPIRSAS